MRTSRPLKFRNPTFERLNGQVQNSPKALIPTLPNQTTASRQTIRLRHVTQRDVLWGIRWRIAEFGLRLFNLTILITPFALGLLPAWTATLLARSFVGAWASIAVGVVVWCATHFAITIPFWLPVSARLAGHLNSLMREEERGAWLARMGLADSKRPAGRSEEL